MKDIIEKIKKTRLATGEELLMLLKNTDGEIDEYLFSCAREVCRENYGGKVYLRGLIEFTNYCKNNCLYCGIRRSNKNAQRYRLGREEILECCKNGYSLGFRTFVLQGGEDGFYSDDMICEIVSSIKKEYPDCAVTLSIGEKPRESYERYFKSGADRYLLRHETANKEHYSKLHPPEMSFDNRMRCLKDLKEIGFQVGAGLMVGSPFQTAENLVEDLLFLADFQPDMIGIGPFIPHGETPFAGFESGKVRDTLAMVALSRLLVPKALIPATTALGTIHPKGREMGLNAGANVVMPNLSPLGVRKLYDLYENKICTGEEAAECLACIKGRIASAGFEADMSRSDRCGL